jgi:hypothetical protein
LFQGDVKVPLFALGLLISSTGNSILFKKMTNKMTKYEHSDWHEHSDGRLRGDDCARHPRPECAHAHSHVRLAAPSMQQLLACSRSAGGGVQR